MFQPTVTDTGREIRDMDLFRVHDVSSHSFFNSDGAETLPDEVKSLATRQTEPGVDNDKIILN